MLVNTYLPLEVGYSKKYFKFKDECILVPDDVSLTLSTVSSNICSGFEILRPSYGYTKKYENILNTNMSNATVVNKTLTSCPQISSQHTISFP